MDAGRTQHGGLLSRYSDSDYAVGAHGDVVITVWRRETKVSGVENLAQYLSERAALFRAGVLMLQVIEEHAGAPSPMARKALSHMHTEKAGAIRRSAVVCTKSGFGGAAARAVITGVAMLKPPAFDHKPFAQVSSAVDWLAQEPAFGKAARISRDSLVQAVERLRATDTFDMPA